MAGDNLSAQSCQQKAAQALVRTHQGMIQASPCGFSSSPFLVETLTHLVQAAAGSTIE